MNEELIRSVVENVLQKTRPQPQKRGMTLSLSKMLAEKIEQKARETGIAVVIVLADAGARPVLIHSMDGAYIASYDIALNKAYTSAALKLSTAHLASLSGPEGPLYGIQNTNNGKIVIFGGGEALFHEGELIGALGVSGGTLEQDTFLAAYGKEIYDRLLQKP